MYIYVRIGELYMRPTLNTALILYSYNPDQRPRRGAVSALPFIQNQDSTTIGLIFVHLCEVKRLVVNCTEGRPPGPPVTRYSLAVTVYFRRRIVMW